MRKPTRPVSFRMPADTYAVVRATAEVCGMDISALLNMLVCESLPHLVELQASHGAALRASRTTPEPEPEER